jgi:Rieske 2Fe-2S family protein
MGGRSDGVAGSNGSAARFAIAGRDVLPRERFTSQEFLELEYERLWPRVWQVACREEEIPERGDFVEYRIGACSILVVRVSPERIQAYHNSCRHRGTRLAAGRGRLADQIRCRFHGWRWNLDGSIAHVLDREEFAGVSDADLCLRRCALDTWGGFVFVHMDPDAPPLRTFLDPVPAWLDPYRPENMRFRSYRTTIAPANWKVVLDAFNEGYHIAATHPEMLRWKNDVDMEYQTFGSHTRYGGTGMVETSPRLGLEPGDVDEQELLALKVQDLVSGLPGYFSERDLQALEAMKRTPIPPGKSASEVYLDLRRQTSERLGLDWSHLKPEQILGGDDFLVFPNLLGPVVAGGWFVYRVRPNGLDPDTCIFDVWALQELPPGAEPPPVEHAFHPDWREVDWGLILTQDLENMEHIQVGLHSPAGGLRLASRQERTVRRMHEVIDRYLFGTGSGAGG